MAEIVNSLFGITPESLTAQRQAEYNKQAMDYASMADPYQQANYSIYQGVGNVARGVGGMLGAQDPQLMKAQQRQALLQQEQPTDATGWQNIASKLWQSGDTQGAQEALAKAQSLATVAQKSRESEATIAAKMAEKVTPEARNAAAQADAAGLQRGTPEWQDAYKKSLDELLTKPEKTMAYGSEAERLAKSLFNKPFAQLDQAQASAVDKELERRGLTKAVAGAGKFSPEINLTSKELDWRKQFLGENKPIIDQAANVRQSLNLLDTGTPFAQAAFNNTVVSAFGGDKQKSNAEIKRLVTAGALDTRIANTITNFFEGKTTATTVADQKSVLNAIDAALEARYKSSAKGYSTRLDKANVDSSLVVPSYSELVGTKGSSGQTVNYQGAPATVVSSNPDGTIVIEQNGVRKTLAPKKQ
jgi:hypothetical protein